MSKKIKSFIKGGSLGLLVLLSSFLGSLTSKNLPSSARADYPWACSVSGSDLKFTNTETTPQYVGCVEYTNCNCPGEPRVGFCEIHEHYNWIRQVAPGESGVCNYSQSVESLASCKVHQLDVKVWGGGDYEQQTGYWDSRPNCWFIVNKCESCGEPTPSPTPTPTQPMSTPTPTTPVSTPTPTPPSETACWKECDGDDDCEGDNICQEISGTKRCLNPKCETESDCTCNKNCWDVCGHDNECPSGLSCKQIDDTKRCVKSECDREQDCNCTAPTPPSVLGEEAPKVLPATGFGWDKFAFLGGLVLLLRFLAAVI